jgi:hypothetical protein
MSAKSRPAGKKYFTAAEANATLPLVRAIVKDIVELANALQDRQERLVGLGGPERGKLGKAHQEEVEMLQAEMERDENRLREFEQELRGLGVELKSYDSGLIDFPALLDGREVYLCWRLGEADVAHWHELEAGFAGRQKLPKDAFSPDQRVAR